MTDYDMTQNKNASNYSIQPGYSVDYPKQGTPMDPADHPATDVPDATEAHSGTELSYDYNNKGREMLKDREYGSMMKNRNDGKWPQ